MDPIIGRRLNFLNDQNKALEHAEGQYLLKEAKRKTMEATIFATASGQSVKEREAFVHADKEYVDFMAELASFETKFHYEQRRFKILELAFYGENNTYKNEMQMIRKEGA